MFDEEDQKGPGVFIGAVLALAAVVVLGVIGGAISYGARAGQASGSSVADFDAGSLDALVDVPLTGDLLGRVYFGVGQASLGSDGAAEASRVAALLTSERGRRVVLAGFHDPTGDQAFNAELAKNRAKAVRASLQASGAVPSQIVLRKPESTTGVGSNAEARRVEIRWLD